MRARRDHRSRVEDRDGAVSAGRPAVLLTLSRLPMTAWFVLPALLLPSADALDGTGRPLLSDGLPRPARMRTWPSTPGRRVTLAVASLLLAGVLAFGALSPPERCPDVTADGLRDVAERGRRLVRPQPERRRLLAVPLPGADTTPSPTTTTSSATPVRSWASTWRRGRRRRRFDVAERGFSGPWPADPSATSGPRPRRRTASLRSAPPRSCSPG